LAIEEILGDPPINFINKIKRRFDMDNLNTEIKSKILEFLKEQKIGKSASEIAKATGHNRITVAKYLEIMRAHKLIAYEDIAQAKIWSLCKAEERPSVLIVDDEPYVVDLVALSLLPGKYRIFKAYSGLDALDRVKKDAPDIIILDLMMPGMDGYEVCQKIKENALTQHIPVIMLSAKGENKDKLKGIRLGAEDYITKPFDPMELEARVDQLLRRTRTNDRHSLTKLPGKSGLREALQIRIHGRSEFEIISVCIEDFEKLCKREGFKKGNDMLVIFSRMLSEMAKVSEGSYLAHTDNDHFIIIARKNLEEQIREAFNRMLPYFRTKTAISLSVHKLSSKEINRRRMHVLDALAVLGV